MNFKTLFSIAAIAAITQVTGCAMVQTTTKLDVPVAKSVSTTGPAVNIVSVTDNRKFVYPHEAGDCETPSVENEKMLNDADVKARAFSRQGRCDGGEWANHAMVTVPEGQTIAGNVKDAIIAGLEESGYRVTKSDPSATSISVTVNKFWVGRELDGMGVRYWYGYDIDVQTPEKKFNVASSQSEKIYVVFSFSKASEYADLNLKSITQEVRQRMSRSS